MMLVRTYISPSAIEGFGVFAAEPIAKGQLIWQLDPKFDICVTEAELASLAPHMQEFIARYAYPHLQHAGVLIVDSDNGKYMNHTQSPNTDFTVFDKGYALRDIAAGEEITCDYREFDPRFTGIFGELGAVIPKAATANGQAARR